MNFTKNLVLKENFTFVVADADGMVSGGEHGLYNRDTRFLSRYAWGFDRAAQVLLAHSARPDSFEAHHAVIEGPSQILGVHRSLRISATRLADELEVTNTSLEPQALTLTLRFAVDFADLFEARGWHEGHHPVTVEVEDDAVTVAHRAGDGVRQGVRVNVTGPAPRLTEDAAVFAVRLEPHERRTLSVIVDIDNPLETARPGIPYATWRAALPPGARNLGCDPLRTRVLERAVEDLRALLLFTDEGPVPAAGIPWFVTVFGRDALITAAMLLPHYPEVACGTLRYLAARQGRVRDSFRAEAPGKILHEVRSGELARTGAIPFGRYYGTIDATPLFVMLLHETYRATGDRELVRELRPHWEAALSWMKEDGDPDGDGFLEFAGAAPGEGLTVQSWKDSSDALSHADGTLATGAIAVCEVQGYAYAAYRSAAEFCDVLGAVAEAARWRREADALRRRFHEAFWLERLGTYALALDGDKRPLAVLASDAGQLLWTGIVTPEAAPALVETLFSDALFSGWGFRTLGAGEVRYNPVSYHNGSVWPHDTAIIAGGLARHGFTSEAARLRDAIFDLAAGQADLRPPELVAGYARGAAPPVTYPVACRPQAWAAAALVYLAGLPGTL